MPDTLDAIVESTIYRNDENGYSVVSVKKERREYTVTGVMPELSAGEQVVFSGEWVSHPQYGKQFKAVTCEISLPTTLLGIRRYLGSGLIRGVGTRTAEQIVEAFGTETLEILSTQPERLQELSGMGKKRWKMIAESFREQQETRTAIVFLQQYGIPGSLALKISKQYGDRTAEVVKSNPYKLCDDIEGIGFLTADRIGIQMGIPQDSSFRIQSAVRYVLREAAISAGHVYLPLDELVHKTALLLRTDDEPVRREMTELTIRREIVQERTPDGEVIRVYLPMYLSAEREVAQRMIELMEALGRQDNANAAARISRFEKRNGITFGPQQRQAIISAMSHGVLVITGGPGTGKTTIINCILSLMAEDDCSVSLCAPTGRAAKRMSEATGGDARTIHRLLEYAGSEEGAGFGRNAENPIESDCVIVDEMSMVDLMLMRSLLRAIDPGTRLVLVGDADQLPSVGAGNVLGDILDSGVVPQVRLSEIYRQQGTSRIVVNAHRINHGELPIMNEKGTDFFFERKENYRQAAETIVNLVSTRLPRFLKMDQDSLSEDAMRNIQVLAPARKGECGVQTLNVLLQEALNPPRPDRPSMTHGETLFRVGDKVIQTHNDYELAWRRRNGEDGSGVFNGDVGYVIDIDPEEKTLTVLYDDDREVDYDTPSLDNLDLAYCLSVHKSQGSEFPAVVMPVVGGPALLLTRNLFYTALTRARSLVVLVGREEVIRQMVENDHILKRYTTLCDRLRFMAVMLGDSDPSI